MARWQIPGQCGAGGAVQYYSCPVRCGSSSVDNAAWTACGASATVGVAVAIGETAVAIHNRDIFVGGAHIGNIKDLSSYSSPDGTFTFVLVNTTDGGHEMQLSFATTEGSVKLAVRRFDARSMPTGFVHDVHLSLPLVGPGLSHVDGSCFFDQETAKLKGTQGAASLDAWHPRVLAKLRRQCESFTGEYSPAATHEALCHQTGASITKAHRLCASMATTQRTAMCVADFCALNKPNLELDSGSAHADPRNFGDNGLGDDGFGGNQSGESSSGVALERTRSDDNSTGAVWGEEPLGDKGPAGMTTDAIRKVAQRGPAVQLLPTLEAPVLSDMVAEDMHYGV